MTRLDEVAEQDGWRCWLCDEAVDPSMSVNDSRGPSVDSRTSDAKAKSAGKTSAKSSAKAAGKSGKAGRSAQADGANHGGQSDSGERLAHRGCNTKKGAVKAVVPWPDRLFVADPAPLIGVAERLERKGGREVVGRCPSQSDAQETADWLIDRFSRLVPGLAVTATVEPGGGQFMVALAVAR